MTDAEKLEFIINMDEGDNLDQASLRDVAKYILYCDELCDKKDLTAMQIKAYACYGGNRAYKCDWEMSRDLLEEMLDISFDPFVANTLGYIYYYGRCNHGKPEYEKAYYYYSLGAAGGVYESIYKLSDMYAKGLVVPKNPQIARNMIRDLYLENHRYITRGIFDCKFADIALRMGNVFAQDQSNPNEAFRYYLQAEFAIQKRMQLCDYYGDSKVANIIKSKKEKTLPETDYVEKQEKVVYERLQDLLNGAYHNSFHLELHLKKKKNKCTAEIFIKPREDFDCEPQFFLTIPEAHFCGMKDSIRLTLQDPKKIMIGAEKFKSGEAVITFDRVIGNTLYFYGQRVAAFDTGWKLKKL